MPAVEDKQALINVLKRDTGIPFDQAVDVAVLQLVAIATLNLRRTDASRIAFLRPTRALSEIMVKFRNCRSNGE